MQLIKFSVILVLLTARTCRAKIVFATSRPDESTSNLVEDLVNIVTSCYGDRIDGVGLAGNLPGTLLRTLSVRHLIPVALIGSGKPSKSIRYRYRFERHNVPMKFRHKLHVFIVKASSEKQLVDLFERGIKYSMWWNYMASVFILDMSRGCVNGHTLLKSAWKLDLLNAKVMCYRHDMGRLILNYNPFTRQAPKSWQLRKVFPGVNKHPFTVFSRAYPGTKEICTDLDFEKTKNLGGYLIRVRGYDHHKLKAPTTKIGHGSYQQKIKTKRLFDSFRDVRNATLKYAYTVHYKLTNTTRIDILSSVKWLNFAWSFRTSTDQYYQCGNMIVSQFRGHKTQLDKILSIIDENSRLGMVIVYLVTLIFFKFFVRQALVPVILNLIRITCNTGFTNLPSNTASRIYLGCLFFFVVTMQGIYQGNLACLLTTIVPLPNVNTVQDILNFDYKEICVDAKAVQNRIYLPILKNRFVIEESYEQCIWKVRHNPLSVFYGFESGGVVDLVRKYGLHTSSKPLSPIYMTFKTRNDWPLLEAVNEIIRRHVEGNLAGSWAANTNTIKLTEFEFDEAVRNNQSFKNMDLGELSFAFVILGIGLTFATITLIIELAIQYKCKCRCRLLFVER